MTPKQISFLCTVHPSANIHYLLCSQCGKDPVVPKPVPVVAIRATPLHPLPRPEVIPIKKVVFLTEAVTLIAKDGRKQKVLFVYDSLSGCSLASNIDNAFNWAPPDKLYFETVPAATTSGNEISLTSTKTTTTTTTTTTTFGLSATTPHPDKLYFETVPAAITSGNEISLTSTKTTTTTTTTTTTFGLSASTPPPPSP